MLEEPNLTIKTYMAIMAERNAAIRERDMALDERRRVISERDMAMFQRDAAMAERSSAIEERDKALAVLQFPESSMNENNTSPDSPRNKIIHGAYHLCKQEQTHSAPQAADNAADNAYHPRENPASHPFQSKPDACETAKPRKAKQTEQIKGTSAKKFKSPRKGRGEPEDVNQVTVAAYSSDWKIEQQQDVGGEGAEGEPVMVWKEDDSGLNQANCSDGSATALPVPVCSCTGVPQRCYKWRNGGWQSACCTTTLSMYPLPRASNKRHGPVGGRKMSGSAFVKLLNRLAAEGHDLSASLDLKNHWAKHGTNQYSAV
ncbi:protein BASIC PENTACYSTEINE6-like isoform X2 [Diospyros lotus]|uniref:protein BASIC PENTACYSTEINE6-like isoform X2 n=1 Tax=Diospyros lotus TaxID=55363 RepID=UPI00225A3E48|nr:protein BASIC PENTACYSTEINE6-like isoform X2 [Diospyros lotus]